MKRQNLFYGAFVMVFTLVALCIGAGIERIIRFDQTQFSAGSNPVQIKDGAAFTNTVVRGAADIGRIIPTSGTVGVATLVSGNAGYTALDVLTLVGGSTNATIRVDSVVEVELGVILTYTLLTGGDGYVLGQTYGVTGGTGSGATFSITTLAIATLRIDAAIANPVVSGPLIRTNTGSTIDELFVPLLDGYYVQNYNFGNLVAPWQLTLTTNYYIVSGAAGSPVFQLWRSPAKMTFTGTISAAEPTATNNLTTKLYVDNATNNVIRSTANFRANLTNDLVINTYYTNGAYLRQVSVGVGIDGNGASDGAVELWAINGTKTNIAHVATTDSLNQVFFQMEKWVQPGGIYIVTNLSSGANAFIQIGASSQIDF